MSGGMLEVRLSPARHEVTAEAFGVRFGVGTPHAELIPRIRSLLPPVARECESAGLQHHFTIAAADEESYDVRYDIRDGEVADLGNPVSSIATHIDLEFGLAMLESYVRGALALTAPNHLFIAAGVVSLEGRAIVLPGHGLTGKTTLVDALVREGAVFHSDEYAILDEDGLVHAYRRPEPMAQGPLPVGAVVITTYRPGASWSPRRLSQGESVLSLVAWSVPHQEEPVRSMRVIAKALEAGPPVWQSERGEAGETVPLLLTELQPLLANAR